MIFAILLFLSAFLLEGVATYLSITGLVATFSMSWAIVTLAVALDAAKLTAVTFIYKYWDRVHQGMKAYLIPAIIVLMTITAIGSYGFLIEHFQTAIQDNKESNIKIQIFTEEKAKLEARKIQIDKQIANLPDNMVRGRTKLIAQFKDELAQVNARVTELDKEIPKLKLEQVAQETHIGPIAVLAKVFNTELELAIQWIVILIVAVMDPLAIVLILAGNRLLDIRAEDRETSEVEQQKKELSDEKFKIEKEKLKLAEKEVALEESKLDAQMTVLKENPKEVIEVLQHVHIESPHINVDQAEVVEQVAQSNYRHLYEENKEEKESTYYSGHVFDEPEPVINTREKLVSLVQPMEIFPVKEEIEHALVEEVPSSALDGIRTDDVKFFTDETGGHNTSSAFSLYKNEGVSRIH